MPRAFSSGALSIWSNATNCTFGLFFASTFVIAAVNVVLPWSTCPIVPMFTCGLERSNFSFDIFPSSYRYYLLLRANAGAGDEIRTRDPQLGRLMLYQLSYTRPKKPFLMADF